MNTFSGTRKNDEYTIDIDASMLKNLCDMVNVSRPASTKHVDALISSFKQKTLPIQVVVSLPKEAVVTYYGEDEVEVTVPYGSMIILDGVIRLIAADIIGAPIHLTIHDTFYRIRKIDNLFK